MRKLKIYLDTSFMSHLYQLDAPDKMKDLAEEIIRRGILTPKSLDDTTHIAAAIVNGCDIIVSWNFKHMVNVRTIDGVREIVVSKRYKSIDIYSPPVLLKGDD